MTEAARGADTSLRPLLQARSVAVVGASARAGSFGNALVRRLVEGGFAGPVRPVNPRYEVVEGLACVPSLDELSDPVDLVLLGVGPDKVEEQLAVAARAGVPAAVVFTGLPQGTSDAGLRRIATGFKMAVCGANCMGFVNIEQSLRACAYRQPADLRPGPVAFISHSGSAFSSLLHTHRAVRFNVAISAGTEFGASMDQYLEYALGLESTRAVALFMETSRDPGGLVRALARAAALDIPVVCLKVGRDERTRAFVATHSGALAGEDNAYQAVFDAYGVLRVGDLDEMMDTLELLTAGRRPAAGGFAAVTDSGGERALLSDAAAELGVSFPALAQPTRRRLAGALSPALVPDNPLDAWDALEGAAEVFTQSLLALHDDPGVSAVGLAVDLIPEDSADVGYVKIVSDVWRRTSKPVMVLSHVASAVSQADAMRLRAAGVPVLEGTRSGLAAVRHMFAYRDHHALAPVLPVSVPAEVTLRWRERLADPEPIGAAEGFALLADYQIPVVPIVVASSPAEVLAAGDDLGWPVVLKTAAPGIGHKSDAGGVRLGVASAADLNAAYREMSSALGPLVTVSASADAGVELALGIVRDPQFGPLVMIGAGGVLVELLQDRVFGVPPLDAVRVTRMLDRLKCRPLLDGFRTIPTCDIDAVAGAVTGLSALAADLGDLIAGLDINPLIATPAGCVAVDVLISRL